MPNLFEQSIENRDFSEMEEKPWFGESSEETIGLLSMPFEAVEKFMDKIYRIIWW